MNILFLTNNPNLGSTARVFLDWFPLLSDRGHKISVIAPRIGPLQRWLSERGIRHSLDPLNLLDKHAPWKGLSSLLKATIHALPFRPDIIHCMEHNVYPFAWRLGRILGCRVVTHIQYRVDRGFCSWAFGGGHPPSWTIWTAQSQYRECQPSVEGLIAQERQSIIPLGIDPDRFGLDRDVRAPTRESWGISDDDVVFGMACALRERKRVEDFVESIRRAAFIDDRVKGVLAGGTIPEEAEYARQIFKLLEKPTIRRCVTYVGSLTDMEPFNQGIDVAVTTSEYETFGMSVCEAMACERPVVGFACGSIPEVVGSAGRLVDLGDVSTLSQAIVEIAGDASERRRIGHTARERVITKFSPASTFQQLMTIYRSIL